MKFSKEMFSGRNLYSAFLHVAVVVLAIQVVVLAKQNEKFKNPSNVAGQEQLKEGDSFYFGRLTSVREGEKPDTTQSRQLVFVFTTRCSFCKASIPFWKKLAEKRSSGHSVMGVSLDPLESTATYVAENDINFPVFVPNDLQLFINQVKNTVVPKTIVRNKSGVVEKFILGKLQEGQLAELVNFTSVLHN